MAAYTFDQIALHTENLWYRAIMNIMREDSSILEVMPWSFWGTGKKLQYEWEKTRPTVQEYGDNETLSEYTGDDMDVESYLKRVGHQFALENFQTGTMQDAESNAYLKGARAFGEKLRSRAYAGVSTSVAIGTGSGTKGVTAVIPSARTRPGVGSLKFNDTGDLLQYKAPGDTAYGTAVAVTADLAVAHHYLFSGNKSWWIRISFTIASSAGLGDWEYTDTTDGLTFTTTKQIDGLQSLVQPDLRFYGNKHATTPTTNGDLPTLNALDFLFRQIKGPKGQKVGFMRGNVIDYIRGLIGANARPADWQGTALSSETLDYRGYALLPDDCIAGAQTVGATTNCTSIIAAVLDVNDNRDGVCFKYAKARKNATMSSLQDDNSPYGVSPVPVFARELDEKEAKDQTPGRMTSYLNCVNFNAQALCELHGIKQG